MAKRFIDGQVNIEGQDGSSAIGAGYVGETKFGTTSVAASSTTGNHVPTENVAVGQGIWLVSFRMYKGVSGSMEAITGYCTDSSTSTSQELSCVGDTTLGSNMFAGPSSTVVVCSSGSIKFHVGQHGTSLNTSTFYVKYMAVRIA